jgi:2-iminobutanoate/2-iminopropanoate deaminase
VSTGIEPITAEDAAAPAAHYSQAVRSGDLVWSAGTVGTDPASGQIVEGFEAQVHQAITNVRAALRAAGTDLDQVVKANCFVTRREDFPKLDPIYREYFPTPPGRTTVVCDLVVEELLFEIEVVARVPS